MSYLHHPFFWSPTAFSYHTKSSKSFSKFQRVKVKDSFVISREVKDEQHEKVQLSSIVDLGLRSRTHLWFLLSGLLLKCFCRSPSCGWRTLNYRGEDVRRQKLERFGSRHAFSWQASGWLAQSHLAGQWAGRRLAANGPIGCQSNQTLSSAHTWCTSVAHGRFQKHKKHKKKKSNDNNKQTEPFVQWLHIENSTAMLADMIWICWALF